MLVAGVGAVPAQATKPGVVPIETVKGDFGSKTHFLYSESLKKDGKKIDAGLGDLITAENGTFAKTAKAAAVDHIRRDGLQAQPGLDRVGEIRLVFDHQDAHPSPSSSAGDHSSTAGIKKR
ncbi:hypothetical protein O159_01960 [Leifsonia xyli subsp. cynodontis DSM 46306]|uniref:Uncharacterized protein n=1 Tax=Leifsonia xyli subsp. cynodontis DSM 46306 TaxID=1389489 RepID=U3P2B3_LEIXC|nr:hypothetical protein O159_01960 [Leifsonia xyli subsp. cynodontis DSM 46306]